jgi:acetyltransferase-like isoleucine patch superfamily enzyme
MIKLKEYFPFLLIRIFVYRYLDSKKSFKSMKLKLLWRDNNPSNFTMIDNRIEDMPFPSNKVTVGNYTYGPLRVISYGSNDEYLSVGRFCSIASGVKFLLGGEHKLNKFSTFPFKRILIDNDEIETFSKGNIILEDDVWIGTDSLILSGVRLSRGTVVAAGSVVTKSTDPYSIIGGNPAKLIKKRFSEDIIENLMNVDYNILTENFIKEKIGILDAKIDKEWFGNL